MAEESVEKDILIGELLKEHPEVSSLLKRSGFHCVGCGMASMETLEQGCKAHGFSDKMIDELLEKINKTISGEISLSESAEEKLSNEFEGGEVRIKKNPEGFEIVEGKVKDEDRVFEQEELTLIVDPESLKELRGKTLDFHNGGFVIS